MMVQNWCNWFLPWNYQRKCAKIFTCGTKNWKSSREFPHLFFDPKTLFLSKNTLGKHFGSSVTASTLRSCSYATLKKSVIFGKFMPTFKAKNYAKSAKTKKIRIFIKNAVWGHFRPHQGSKTKEYTFFCLRIHFHPTFSNKS